MPLVRALVTWHRASEPFANACSNTLYFRVVDGIPDVGYGDLADDIRDKYIQGNTGGYLAPNGWGINVRLYDMSDPLPRPIKYESTGTFGGTLQTTAPREVALCLSYYGDRNLARTRGRIYLGPFNSASGERPAQAMMNALITFGQSLAGIGGEDQSWRLYSPTTGEDHHIRHIWVNDEWDTMRSRQLEETVRVTADV